LQRTYYLPQLSCDDLLSIADLARIEWGTGSARCHATDTLQGSTRQVESLIPTNFGKADEPSKYQSLIIFQSISYLMTAYLDWFVVHSLCFNDTIKQWNREDVLTNIISEGSTLLSFDWRYHVHLHSDHSPMIIARVGIKYNLRTLSYRWNPQQLFSWVEGTISLTR
jgi:hypothetical protein